MSTLYQGSCSCSAVRVQLVSSPLNVFNCHCSICRRGSGAAFATYAVFPGKHLEIVAGDDELVTAVAGEHGLRHFCRRCGTTVYGLHSLRPGICLIPVGVLEQADRLVPRANVFCDSALPWTFRLAEIPGYPAGFKAD